MASLASRLTNALRSSSSSKSRATSTLASKAAQALKSSSSRSTLSSKAAQALKSASSVRSSAASKYAQAKKKLARGKPLTASQKAAYEKYKASLAKKKKSGGGRGIVPSRNKPTVASAVSQYRRAPWGGNMGGVSRPSRNKPGSMVTSLREELKKRSKKK